MFCYSAIVRSVSGRSSGGCGNSRVRVRLSPTETNFDSILSRANSDVTQRASTERRPSTSRSFGELQQRDAPWRIAVAPEHQTAASSNQLFSGTRTPEWSRSSTREVSFNESYRPVNSSCLAIVANSCRGNVSDCTRSVLTEWASSLGGVDRARSCEVSIERQRIRVGGNPLLGQQCREFCTSSSVRLQLSTVGSQSSKKGPVKGPKPDPPAAETIMDVTDKVNVPAQEDLRNVPHENATEPVKKLPQVDEAKEDPKKVSQDEWRRRLDKETFKVCRLKGTEIPGSGKYLNHSEKGTYICVCCRADLFRSEDKFNHCGWPSFRQVMGTKPDGSEDLTNVKREYDGSHGMVRVEVLCKKCNSHLGHVFDDGPEPFGTRFCINSVSLDFVKDS